MIYKTHRLRLLILAIGTMFVFGVIVAQLYAVQIRQAESFRLRAEAQQNQVKKLIPHRGDILDRNGFRLATSYVSDTIYLDTRKFTTNPDADTAATDDATSETTTTSESALVRVFKERMAHQREKDMAKERAKAQAAEARRNKNKLKAWDEQGVDPQLIEDLAAALCSVDTPNEDDDSDTEGAQGNPLQTSVVSLNNGQPALPVLPQVEPPQPMALRMSPELARERVLAMFAKRKRHLFYPKAPEALSQRMTEIEAKYALPHDFIIYEKHSKRFYPNGALASHLVGFTKIDGSGDNLGASGIEREYNEDLKGAYASQKIQISSTQRGLSPLNEQVIESTYGNNVVLTIDQQLQMFTEHALKTQVGLYQAKGGIALVMDVHTGAIVALASCPNFDLNNFAKARPEELRNRILTDPIEIGSVMKIITATLTIEKGLVTPEEIIDCSSPHVFGTRIVKDTHSVGSVPFRTAFAESSNVGLVTVGLRLNPADYYTGLVRFGLGQPTRVDLGGEGKGVLRDLSQWSVLTRSSLPMGYETSLTPMQVISALGAVGNDGVRVQPHLLAEVRSLHGDLVRSGEVKVVEHVASAKTCQTIRELMEGVVLEGTGKVAAIPGYRVGGKTGTSVKYSRAGALNEDGRKYYASFAGLLPIDKPRFAIYCYVDEPVGAKFGGTVAAPIFRAIALATAQIFNIPPSDPQAFQQAKFDSLNPLNDLAVTSSGLLATTNSTLLMAQLNQRVDAGKEHGRKAAAVPALPGMDAVEDIADDKAMAAGDAASSATWARTFARDTRAKPAPDLRGLTMSDAFAKLADAELEGNMLGTGRAVAQQPPPGAPVHAGDAIKVRFMLSNETPNRQTLDLTHASAEASLKSTRQSAAATPPGPQHVTLKLPGSDRSGARTGRSTRRAVAPPLPEAEVSAEQ